MIKHCFYCSEDIDTKNDDFEKKGKRYICSFCWEEYSADFEAFDPDEDEEED